MAEPAPTAAELEVIVGLRFEPRGPLAWFRAGAVPAEVGSWAVGLRGGAEAVGQVIVGRGQCLGFPADPAALPELLRAATEAEIPRPPPTAGRALLDSLP